MAILARAEFHKQNAYESVWLEASARGKILVHVF